MTGTALQGLVRYGGATAGLVLWSINTQLGQVLPYVECRIGVPLLAAASWASALLCGAAAVVSWRSATALLPPSSPCRSDAAIFVARLSGLTGAIVAFALLLQGASSLLLTGCER